jgi:3-oxoadipate enol-lactonase
VMLLHGWTSTAALNFYRCFSALSDDYRVVALDHRGHGQGIRSRTPFRLEDCADDTAALAAHLELGPIILVGYSMGGPVAQLVWRRHRHSVAGLVLCATAASFPSRFEKNAAVTTIGLGASMALSFLPTAVRRQGMQWATRNWSANNSPAAWALEEWGRHDLAALLQAAVALGRFDSSGWIGDIDVPTAVVVTEHDQTVAPKRQRLLAEHIPGALAIPIPADHRACVDEYRLFVPALLEACRWVGSPTTSKPAPSRA